MNADNKHITDDLLVKHLLAETDADENLQVEQWINENEANRKYYADFKLIWQESEHIAANNNPDEDAAWNRLQNRIGKNDNEQAKKIVPLFKSGWLKIAVAILLISAVGYFAYNQFYNNNTINKISGTTTLTENLPDGSSVTLNSNSQIIYPLRFQGNQRLVQLSGEGFFKVAPDKAKPFIIKIKNVTISVVGTSFNVKNVEGSTEVIVATGIVKVNSHGKQVLLHPGEKVIADENNDKLTVEESKGSLYNYYITKALICDRTPLYQLVDKLNQVYGVHIQIANKQLYDLPITTVFRGQSLNQVLKVIAETFNIKVENNGNLILLK